ncbi:MAG: MotA/TolQ/ExbB proton channel family protein [Pseudomonadota bacterium]
MNSDSAETAASSTHQSTRAVAIAAACVLGVAALVLLAAGLFVLHSNLAYSAARLGLAGWLAAMPGFGDLAVTAPDGRVSLDAALAPHAGWVQPLLKDLSAISPLLVVLTALQLLMGSLRLARGVVTAIAGPRFPFARSYQVYYVQLGLIGTVVGFVLAFAEIDLGSAAEAQTEVLLGALGTALWSTLTALILAYMVCPVCEAVYRWLAALRNPAALVTEPGAAVAQLSHELTRAAEALNELTASVSATAVELDLRDVAQRLAGLDERLSALARDGRDVVRTVDSMASSFVELQNTQSDLLARVAVLERQSASSEARALAMAGVMQGAVAALAPPPAQTAEGDEEPSR